MTSRSYMLTGPNGARILSILGGAVMRFDVYYAVLVLYEGPNIQGQATRRQVIPRFPLLIPNGWGFHSLLV